MPPLPFVSVIVPCFNEQATIRLMLDGMYHQTYPRDCMEIILADGMSTDRTRQEIAAYLQDHSALQVKVVDNPRRSIPAGLNRAIAAASGELVVRSDAHSVPYPDYVERNVLALQEGRGDVVGGIWEIKAGSAHWIGRAIAVAGAHPLGVGDALYRYSRQAQYVDTVPFGAFRRDLLDRLSLQDGPFDETLLTNEDYEFYTRVRRSGGRIWLDPDIRSVYFSRSNLAGLMKQYWRYGFWKLRMLIRYPQTIRWRQALPPLFVLSLLTLGSLALFNSWARWLLFIELVIYSAVLLAAGGRAAFQRKDPALFAGVPIAISLMHLCWGGAFLLSLAQQMVQSIKRFLFGKVS